MLRTPFIILFTLLAATTAAGRTLDVRPGEIAAGIEIPARESVLTITGQLDAADLNRLAMRITEVETLDLSGVEIVAYKGARIGVNITTAPAATLPRGIFAGLRVNRLILPATLTAIGEGALADATVTELSVPDAVTYIGNSAFAGCKSMHTLTLPRSLTVIPDGMAEGCEALTSVTIPDGVTEIGDRAFFGCPALTDIAWPRTLNALGDEAFAISGIRSADLSRCTSLSSIGARAFARCQSLSVATLPDGAAEMGQGVFFECKTLASVRLPASAVTVPAMTLKGADGLTRIELPAAAEVIDTFAFAGMSQVAELTLPPALNHIADGAFENASGLAVIDGSSLPAVPSLGNDVWAGINQGEVILNVARSLENSFLAAPQWQDFSIRYTGVITAGADRDGELDAAFDGMILVVTSAVHLSAIELYSVDGQLLTAVSSAETSGVSIDTSAYAGPFFIVRAITATDSLPVTFKLLRQP